VSRVASQRWARHAAFLIVEEIGATEAETLLHKLRQILGAGKTTEQTLSRIAGEVFALKAGRALLRKAGTSEP